MTDITETTGPSRTFAPRWSTPVALLGILILCCWVFYDLGGFELTSMVVVGNETRELVSVFATVDHPFHATRADMLLKALENGEMLRWIPAHQGGYPVEFYPLGIPWLDIGLWALLLGQFPIIAVHKLAVLLMFVLPVVGFWILARGDRVSPFIPLLALAIHVAVPGDWMHGGRMELVYWGLIANVGGATLAFIMMAALSRWVREGGRGYGVLATLAAAAALYTNTRSSIAIVIGTLAIVVAALIAQRDTDALPLRTIITRVAVVAFLSMLLTAPLLLAALRFTDLYYFVNFESYEDLGGILWASKTAITPVIGIFTLAGAILTLVVRRYPHAMTATVGLILFVAVTIAFSLVEPLANTIQQLETPRLMPFQRFLSIYLAAWFAGWLLETAFKTIVPRSRGLPVPALLSALSLAAILTFNGVFGTLPTVYQQPTPWTTGYPEYGEFQDAVTAISDIRPEDTAIFVVGDQMSWWHEQLWSPVWSDAMFFYDDWMWYWHPDHDGPYDPSIGHAYQDPAAAFDPEWFHAHGVGAVLVTNMPVHAGATDPRIAARTNPNLEFQQTIGQWDLYLVTDPGTIVTNGTAPATEIDISNNTISAIFDSASGEISVRRNWYPRWEAFADGEQVDVTRLDNGYMSVTVPEGTTTVELRYAVTAVDWLGRIAAVIGVALTAAFALNAHARFERRPRANPVSDTGALSSNLES
jgi:hypothetical protein